MLFLADGRLVSDMRSPTADRVLDTIRELTEPRDGLLLGMIFGRPIVAVLRSRGVITLVLPAGQLFAMAGLAGLAGIVAAIAPGRRAARRAILRAVTTE